MRYPISPSNQRNWTISLIVDIIVWYFNSIEDKETLLFLTIPTNKRIIKEDTETNNGLAIIMVTTIISIKVYANFK